MRKFTPIFLISLSCLLPASAQDVRFGLVSYWPLDEVSGDGLTTPDKAGWGTDLTLVNMDASNVVAGTRGNAITFNGTDEILFANTDTGANPGLPLQNNVRKTIAMWVKGDGTAQQDKRFFAEASMVSTTPMFNMGTDSAPAPRTGKLDLYIRNDANGVPANHLKSAGTPFDGSWHHLAMTDDNGTVRIFVDGVQEAAALTYTRAATTLTTLSLGGIQRLNGALAFYNGAIDDVAVWNRILTAAEIQNVMNNGLATPTPPLVGVDRTGPYLQGDRVGLSVHVNGPAPVTYQWRRNGVDIPGATESTFVVSALTAATQGDYTVLLDGTRLSDTVALSFTADPAAALATNIVSWWPMNTINDDLPPATPDPWGGNPLFCTDIDAANLVPGKFGTAMEFDGVSEYALRSTGFPIASSAEYSVALWVKADGTVQNDLRFFAEGSNTSNTPLFGMGTATDGSNHMRMYVRSDANAVLVVRDSQSAVLDDTWHHVAWTDRNGKARLYVDGVMDGTSFDYNRTGQVFTLNQTSMGAIQRAITSHFCKSALDDVAVWNRALTWTEVQQLVATGVPAPVAAVPPDVTVHPLPRTLWAGRAFSVSVQAVGTAPFTYQWFKDGNPLPDSEPTLLRDPAEAGDSGSYTCKVTNSAGTETSNPAAILVRGIAGLDTGRISAWPLDAGAASTPDTLSSHDLTLSNLDPLTAFQPGVKNNALFFDGADDLSVHTRTGLGSDLPLTTREEYTVSFWVRGTGTGQLDRRVFSESSTSNVQPLFNIGTDAAGVSDLLYFFIRGDGGGVPVNHIASTVRVFDGYWHHVTYTDRRGHGQLYVDGVLDVTLNYARPVSTFTNISVGGIARATPSHWFRGGVDEVNTWERALSEAEATQLYQSMPHPAPTLSITDITIPAEGQIQLTVATSLGNANFNYQVESSTDLTTGTWSLVQDAIVNPASNGVMTVDLSAVPVGRRYYRVLVP